MAPLPQNNTNRIFLDYTSMGIPHVAEYRIQNDLFGSDQNTMANQLAEFQANYMVDTDSVYGARWQQAGDNFSTTLGIDTWEGVNGTAGFIWAEDPEAAFITIPVRSYISGRRGRWCLFTPYRFGGTGVAWPTTNRFAQGTNTAVDALIAALKDIYNGVEPYLSRLCAIDQTNAQAYSYVNISKNAYWERKQRG